MAMQLLIKVRGILRSCGKVLFCYHKEQDFYFLPGGTLESGENATECLQREFREECQLAISCGALVGCLECHWQDGRDRYQELDMIFNVHAQQEPMPEPIKSLEEPISFVFLPLQDIAAGIYSVLPVAVVKFLRKETSLPSYVFENQLTT